MSTGGGGTQATSTATNTTTVNTTVNVPFNVDTAPIQKALTALAGVTAQGQAVTVAAVATIGKLAQAQQAQAASQGHVELLVAALGVLAALIAAHVFKGR